MGAIRNLVAQHYTVMKTGMIFESSRYVEARSAEHAFLSDSMYRIVMGFQPCRKRVMALAVLDEIAHLRCEEGHTDPNMRDNQRFDACLNDVCIAAAGLRHVFNPEAKIEEVPTLATIKKYSSLFEGTGADIIEQVTELNTIKLTAGDAARLEYKTQANSYIMDLLTAFVLHSVFRAP